LKRGGVLASLVGAPSQAEAKAHGARAAAVSGRMSLAQLNEIAQLIDAGIVRPIVSEVMPLSDARKAHELSESHHVHGKIVLKVLN
jgi:NADPH:quinone reductase-like Zn-dependent oxidoreductase